jgi:AhpD family alkylhydroperoxidase
MSLAIGVAVRCDHCILWHTDAALEAKATHDEVVDSLTIAVGTGGSPAMTYAVETDETLLGSKPNAPTDHGGGRDEYHVRGGESDEEGGKPPHRPTGPSRPPATRIL